MRVAYDTASSEFDMVKSMRTGQYYGEELFVATAFNIDDPEFVRVR